MWAIAVLVTGGFVIEGSLFRLRSRDPARPFLLAAFTLITYLVAYRRHLKADAAALAAGCAPRAGHWPAAAAIALAAATLAVGIYWGSFVAGGSDASGYVSQAELWLRGELVRPRPAWALEAPWPADWPTTPLGYQPGPDPRTVIPTYAPGLPLLMTVFQALAGRPAVFYAVPVFGALGVWVTYLLGRRLGNPHVGLVAAALLFASPAYLFMLVQPMADVPAAAMWALALYFACGDRWRDAAAAGLATAVAILIRPNIVPLAGIVGLVLLLKPEKWRRLPIFIATVTPAAMLIAALNTYFFGSAISSGYGPLDSLYSLDRVGANLSRYGGWLLSSQTPLVLLALVSPFAWPGTGRRSRLETALVTVAFPALVLALYLPYYLYDQWWYLRFLLPAYPVLSIGVAVVLVGLAARAPWPRIRPWLPWLLVVPVAWHGLRYSREPFGGTQAGDQRYVRMIDYIPRLPANAIFVSLTHSGTIAYYTGRDVLRWEGLYDRARLDTAVEYLRDRGFNVYLVVDYGERAQFAQEFAATRTAAQLAETPARDLGDPIVYALGGSELPPAR